MLQAEDDSKDELPFDPILEEVEALLARRSFEEALKASRRHAEGAGPALRTALRKLEQRAEQARAIEPDIMRCMANARHSLQAGNVREALPQLKQVLTLDRTHPVARRLMDGLLQRARRQNEGEQPAAVPAPTAAKATAPVADMEQIQDLPATGNPGSDEPPSEVFEPSIDEPAPLGQGLPSSPVGAGPDPSAPEIELDMLSLGEGEESAAVEDGEELIVGAPMAIELQDEEPAIELKPPATSTIDSRRGAAGVSVVEAPFENLDDAASESAAGDIAVTEAQSAGMPPPVEASPVAGETSIPEMTSDDLAAVLGSGEAETASDPLIPRVPAPSSRKGLSPGIWGGVAGGVLLIAIVAAWQMGWIFSSTSDFNATAGSGQQAAATAPVAASGDSAKDGPTAEPGARAEVAAVQTGNDPGASVNDARQALMLLEQGQDLVQARRPTAALEVFRRAQALDPVNGEITTWVSRLETEVDQQGQQAADQEAAVAAFENKKFEIALRGFYRMEDKSGDGPYQRYIVNSWYNWGLQLLAAGNLREAAKKMDEVLTLQPGDEQAATIKKLVTSYGKKAKDRGFYQQIEALHYRLLDS